ncbi:hypothetical protein GQX74_005920 [Glossina fuscipes]|nr:hypothetical protein GQX74_005920 [Glossina fuscipes]
MSPDRSILHKPNNSMKLHEKPSKPLKKSIEVHLDVHTSAPRLQQPIDFHENFDNEEGVFNVILDDLFLNSDLIRKEVNEDSMLLESYGSPLSTCTHSSPSPSIGPGVAGAPPSSPIVGVMWRRLSPELFGMITPRLMGSSLVHGFIGSLVVVVLAGSSIVIVRTVIGSAVGVMMVTSSASSTGSLALARASPSSVANLSSTAAIFIRVVEPAAGGQPLEIPVGDVDFGIGSESAIHAALLIFHFSIQLLTYPIN